LSLRPNHLGLAAVFPRFSLQMTLTASISDNLPLRRNTEIDAISPSMQKSQSRQTIPAGYLCCSDPLTSRPAEYFRRMQNASKFDIDQIENSAVNYPFLKQDE
jgi:hypothetical protein